MVNDTTHSTYESELEKTCWSPDATSITFKLRDELHHPQFAWPLTLLSYPLFFERRGIHTDLLHLIDKETGKEVPFQLSEMRTDGTDLVAARIHFLADLPSGGERLFQLQLERGEEAYQPGMAQIHTEVEGDTIVVQTGTLQVRIPCSQTVRANIAPGPIMQLNRGQGWIGEATLQGGEKRLLSLETKQVELGPLFATYQVTYHFAEDAIYTTMVRAILGYDFVELAEQIEGLDQSTGTCMEIAWHGFSPTHRFSSTWPGSQVASDYATGPESEGIYQWRGIDDPIVVGYNGEDPVFSGRSRVEQPDKDFAFTVGPYAPSYAWNARPHATYWDTVKVESLGVFVRNPDQWDDQAYAIWASADILQIHFRYAQGILHWTWPLANGTRQTGIAFYDHARDIEVLREQDRQAQALATLWDIPLSQALLRTQYLTTYTRYLHHWYSTLSLDLVKGWILSYSGRRPLVLFKEGQVSSSRMLIQQLLAGSEGPRLIAQGINELAGYLNIGQRPMYDYFLDGYNRLSPQLNAQQREQVDALFLLTAYISAREEIGPLRHMLGGHPNFMADGKAVLPCFAWLYPEHPLAAEWRDLFEAFLSIVGVFHTRPALPALQARAGRWTESLSVYIWAFLRPVVSGNFMGLLTDGRNRCAHPFLGEMGNWLVNTLSTPIAMQPPTDYLPGVTPLTRENGFLRLHPPQGAHSAWPRRPPLEMWMLGQFLRNYRPLVAEHLLWGCNPTAYRLEADASTPNPWSVLADPEDTNRGTNPHLRSCKYTGYGIILRANVDLPTEIAVVLQQVDRGPNYRWGIGGANGSGTLYYYAHGRAYSGHGREDAGDRRREDLTAISTFGVWKNGTFRTIGENVLERPFYDLEVAQYAELVARGDTQMTTDPKPLQDNYALPEYRGRSVLLVGSDYIVTYDAIMPGQWCAWSWFTLTRPTGKDANSIDYLPDRMPFIHAVRGVAQGAANDCIVQTPTSRGVRLESDLSGSTSDVLVVVSHREDLQIADGASTPWGTKITMPHSTDYVFRYQGETYYQPQQIHYASDGLTFVGTAGLIRLLRNGIKHLALFHGSQIGTQEVSITVDNPNLGVSLFYHVLPELVGHYFTPEAATFTLNLPGSIENARLYIDGMPMDVKESETQIRVQVSVGQHRWQLTRGLPEPMSPTVLRTENCSNGARIYFTTVPGAESYELQVSKDNGNSWLLVGMTTDGHFHLTGQRNGTKIHVRVVARNAQARSRPGHEYPIYVSDALAPPPDGLNMNLDENSVTLTWGEVLGVARYHLYRCKRGDTDFQEIFSDREFQFVDRYVPGVIPAYQEPGLAANVSRDMSGVTIYEYAIASENENGIGEKSLPISTDPRNWRNWKPATELKFRRQHSYNQPPYVDESYTPPLYYDEPMSSST